MKPPEEQEAFDTINAKLQQRLERWYQGDTLGYAELFADEFPYYDPMTKLRLETIDQLRDHYAALANQWSLPRYELIDPRFHLHGDIGILTYFLKQFSEEGPVGSTWKTTEVYQPVDGEWRIIHAHWSTIPEGS